MSASVRSASLDVVGNSPHAVDPFRGPLGRQLARIRVDEAGQRDCSVPGGDADGTRLHLGVPLELPHDGIPHLQIGFGQYCSGHGPSFTCASSGVNSVVAGLSDREYRRHRQSTYRDLDRASASRLGRSA
jgi:hypothetical protein